MNRLFLPLIFVFLLTVSSVHADEVAMVVKDAGSLDSEHELRIKYVLQDMGHSVTLVDANVTVDYSEFDLIVIAGRPGLDPSEHLGDFVAGIPVNEHPSIAIDSRYIDDFGWVEDKVSRISSSQKQSVYIIDEEHYITEGYTGTVTVHTIPDKLLLGLDNDKTNMTQVASINSAGNKGVISVAMPGTELFDGNVTNEGAVFFGIPYPIYWTSEAEDFFKKSVNWLIADTDMDGVPDNADMCQDTPPGEPVGSDGCTCLQKTCDDLNECTYDSCDEDTGECVYANKEDGASCGSERFCPEDYCDPEDPFEDLYDYPDSGYDYCIAGVCTERSCELINVSYSADCDPDNDDDGILDTEDNCPDAENPGQEDWDSDGVGDACDDDYDNDGIPDDEDEYPEIPSAQADADNDGVLESALDSDSVPDNGFENYTDPDSNSDTIRMDVDSDSKYDYLVDAGNDSSFERYWDPDDGILTLMTAFESSYLIDSDGDGIPDKRYEGSVSGLAIINQDVDNDGEEEIVLDLNGNAGIDSSDRVWDSGLYSLPDLFVNSISFSDSSPVNGTDVTVTAEVKNQGGYRANDFVVEFYVDDSLEGNVTISLDAGESVQKSFTWRALTGSHTTKVKADAENNISESDEDNNIKTEGISVSSSSSSSSGSSSSGSSGSSGGGGGGSSIQVRVSGIPGEFEVNENEENSFTVTVQNRGKVTLRYVKVEVAGIPSDWVSVSPGAQTMTMGEKNNFNVQIRGVMLGKYGAWVKVSYQYGTLEETDFLVNVLEPEGKELKYLAPEIHIINFSVSEIEAGGNGEARVRFKNTGNVTASISFSLIVPEGWKFLPDEGNLELEPGQEGEFVFGITAPQGSSGEQSLSVYANYALADKKETLNKEIKVAIKQIEAGISLSGMLTGLAGFASSYGIFIIPMCIVVVAVFASQRRYSGMRKKFQPPWQATIDHVRKNRK